MRRKWQKVEVYWPNPAADAVSYYGNTNTMVFKTGYQSARLDNLVGSYRTLC